MTPNEPPLATDPGHTTDRRAYRLSGIDAVRGLAIVLMALDHVRDYVMVGVAQDPAANPEVAAGLFFTRWITHFCAPVFVFLAGTSAGLAAARRTPRAQAGFLLKRGLWLVAVECTVVGTAWTFAPWGVPQLGERVLVMLQVIWAIGASMVVLAGAQFLGERACAVMGAVIVVGHNLLDPVWPSAGGLFDTASPWWGALHAQQALEAGPVFVLVVYPLLPWLGVMLLGYGAAPVFRWDAVRRNALLRRCGLAAVVAFLAVRWAGVYGDPNPWGIQASAVGTMIDFLNVTKYPPSLLFLLMTLGIGAALCSLADRLPDAVRRPLVTFGRAPFAYYVAHLYLIHALSVLLARLQGRDVRDVLTVMFFFPKDYGVGLPGVYALWLLVIVALYPFSRWVAGVKSRRSDWWLSYL